MLGSLATDATHRPPHPESRGGAVKRETERNLSGVSGGSPIRSNWREVREQRSLLIPPEHGRQSISLGIGLEEDHARFVGQGARTGGMLSTDQKFASEEIPRAGSATSGSGFRRADGILERPLSWSRA